MINFEATLIFFQGAIVRCQVESFFAMKKPAKTTVLRAFERFRIKFSSGVKSKIQYNSIIINPLNRIHFQLQSLTEESYRK